MMDCESEKESELESKTWEIIKAYVESKGLRRRCLEAGTNWRIRNKNDGTIW